MSVSYQAPLSYNQGYPVYQEPKRKSCAGGAIAGATIGAVTGGTLAARSNPYFEKSGAVVEDFAKKAYQNFVDKGGALVKRVEAQTADILAKIKGVKTPEELRTLFENNKEAVENYCKSIGQSVDEFFETITQRNLRENKEVIKNWFETEGKVKLQSMKNWIEASYDKVAKKFTQVPEITKDAYEAIEAAVKKGNGGKIAKVAAAAGFVGGIAGWCIHNLARSIKEANAEH